MSVDGRFRIGLARRAKVYLLALTALGAAACGSTADAPPQEFGQVAQATALTIYAGGVPIPTVAGSTVPNWNGTYPELLAADALAECTLNQQVGITDGGTSDSDSFLAYLAGKMSASQCSTTGNPAAGGLSNVETFYWKWLAGRNTATCNVDLGASPPVAKALGLTSTSTSTGTYALPSLTIYTGTTLLPQFTGTEVGQARTMAQNHVHYAWLNLCMAEKLRAQIDSSQVALISQTDLQQLQWFVRTRAQAAVYQYTTLLKTIDSSAVTTAISDPWFFTSLIARWKDKDANWAAHAADLGKDLASAVNLLVEAAHDETDVLLRSSAAMKQFGTYKSAESFGLTYPAVPYDSLLTGPRVDALMAGYGAYSETVPRAPVTSTDAPEVITLAGLAAAGGGIQLKGANKVFDLQANANTILWTAVQGDNGCKPTDACWQAQPGGTPDTSILQQKYNIQPKHAFTLVKALLEHLYGRPPTSGYTDFGLWTYRFDDQAILAGLPLDILARVKGVHKYTGDFSAVGGGTLTLDTGLSVVAPSTVKMQGQAWAHVPQKGFDSRVHPYDLGYDFRSKSGQFYYYPDYSPTPPVSQNPFRWGSHLGTQSVLAYLRYYLPRANVNASAVINAAGTPLTNLLRQALGSRQVVVKRTKAATSTTTCPTWSYNATGTGTFTSISSCFTFTNVAGTVPAAGTNVDVYVNTSSADPYTTLAYRVMTSPVPATQPTRVTVAATAETIDASISSVMAGEVIRKYTVSVPANGIADLRLETSDGSSGVYVFQGKLDEPVGFPNNLIVSPPFALQNASTFARSITYGGSLNKQLDHVLSFLPTNWAKPSYDALDLPTDWAPIGDASLNGGSPGEETYQYFLRTAKSAAQDATTAVDKAFQSLTDAASDTLALQQADQKGSTLDDLQTKSFCGATTACTPISYTAATIPVPTSCTVGTFCPVALAQLKFALGSPEGSAATYTIPLATDVYLQKDSDSATFSKYSGGQLEPLLLTEWNAWKALQSAINSAFATATASGSQIEEAESETTAAQATAASSEQEALDAAAALALQGVNLQTQANQLQIQMSQYDAQLKTEQGNVLEACGEDAFNRAVAGSTSYSGPRDMVHFNPSYNGPGTGDFTVPPSAPGQTTNPLYNGTDSATVSLGPLEMQHEACRQATIVLDASAADLQNEMDEVQVSMAALSTAINQSTNSQVQIHQGLDLRIEAAEANNAVATQREAAARREAFAQSVANIGAVKAALGNVLSAAAAIDAAVNQADIATSKQQLDISLQVQDIKSRFNLKSAYHSYDLWRARALSENARRLAVTARRAIESRFVVDLSTLNAPETFVEAPAVWADEIYDSDLKPPSSLGRTLGPASTSTSTTAIYSSKIEDYVNNLQLFVDGYGISRPTAVARSDSDVLQLPGPAGITQISVTPDQSFSTRDPKSAGWSFYCPSGGYWTNDSTTGTNFNAGPQSLDGVCTVNSDFHEAPTRARISFWLNPEGAIDTATVLAGRDARHNARWRQLAVNLVGTGVRDCSKVPDPTSCYAEPFIRYQLRHVGPAQVTDYNDQWHALALPVGNIEDGKALSAEEWVDPVSKSFDNPLVSNVARQEFAGRPLGGKYELILEAPAGVRLDHIDRVQVLVQSDYWVRQE